MTLVATSPQARDLAGEANRLFHLAETHAHNAVDFAIKCGAILRDVKEQLPHGDWLPWLADHFDGSERKAQSYMQLAKAQTSADLPESIARGLKAIARSSVEPENEEPSVRDISRMMMRAASSTTTATKPATVIDLEPTGEHVDPDVQRVIDALERAAETFHESLAFAAESGKAERIRAARDARSALNRFMEAPA